jgi:hypothetical protein
MSELGFMLRCPTSFSSLKIESVACSEASVNYYQSILRSIPEDSILQLISPLSRTLLERLIRPVKKSIEIYGIRRLIAVFTRDRIYPEAKESNSHFPVVFL